MSSPACGEPRYGRLITDRFAPATDGASCDPAARTYCGGTYQTIISKLDYIQGMGFTAIWISPTGLNIEGETEYGEAYHV
jgi:alpha-amylase